MAWRRLLPVGWAAGDNRPWSIWPALLLAGFISIAGTASLPVGIPSLAISAAEADSAPFLTQVSPDADAVGVALDTTLEIRFNEPVDLHTGAVDVQCEDSGAHPLEILGGDETFNLIPAVHFLPYERCVATVFAVNVTDLDADDPPDAMLVDYTWTFTTGAGVARQMVINEFDAITADGRGEFIELYDGGDGGTNLTGLVVVLYRGDSDEAYLAIDLDGYTTDSEGYFVLGTRDLVSADLVIANGLLLDGPDAIALFAGDASDFPEGGAVKTENLVDAIVYTGTESPGAALLSLLEEGEQPLDENNRGQASVDSGGRCPDGAGDQRRTAGFRLGSPTPGSSNHCVFDEPPRVMATFPADGEVDVAYDVVIGLGFNEPVLLADGALDVQCSVSGTVDVVVEGDGTDYKLMPVNPLLPADTCSVYVHGERVHDADDDDPPDVMTASYTWQFTTRRPIADHVMINEVDADTPGDDTSEFIELFDGGAGLTPLDGLALVLFNGSSDISYHTISLEGAKTDSDGYYLVGNSTVGGSDIIIPDGLLQNGPDAVALVAADGKSLPNDMPVSAIAAQDALAYGPTNATDAELLTLLNPAQPQVDEAGRGDADGHSNQRCPNGGGGLRNSSGYRQNPPTPRAANNCITDTPPQLTAVNPADGATGVKIDTSLTIEFSEPVNLQAGWLEIECVESGRHTFNVEGGLAGYAVQIVEEFIKGERCTVTIFAQKVNDLDEDDPPDLMTADYTWGFQIEALVADFVVINEIDADTPGEDTAEFIELYDGGAGRTSLNGLVLVLFNGNSLASYRTFDLSDHVTDEDGFFVIGNSGLKPQLEFSDGVLQNGPDAVALYAGSAQSFPNDAPVTVTGLVDAVVYGDPISTPSGVLQLLLPGQAAADENARGSRRAHSLQRCPNGSGGQRTTDPFVANIPTPGKVSDCITDSPPAVVSTDPVEGTGSVSRFQKFAVTFSEPVNLPAGWIDVTCSVSGRHDVTTSGGPSLYRIEPIVPFGLGDKCLVRITAAAVRDADADDPPDQMVADFEWRFEVMAAVADFVVINELDADTPGSDSAEFIELYDGGRGDTDLTGLVLALFNGNDDETYFALDLTGLRTDPQGYFLIGNSAITSRDADLPDGRLQNGPDAVALLERAAGDVVNGSPVTTWGIVDAVVYGTSDLSDPELMVLLNPGQPPVDENGRDAATLHSIQRCPNGGGGRRNTTSFFANRPTAGRANYCVIDAAPAIAAVLPAAGAVDVAVAPQMSVTFTEGVEVENGWLGLDCTISGHHSPTWIGGPQTFTFASSKAFTHGESCTVYVKGRGIRDLDDDDPPDLMDGDYRWGFSVVNPPAADFIVINEIDPDTLGADDAEFIELYDGGLGNTSLSGLVIVFWNGNDDRSYRTLGLSGFHTDAAGYFIIGNTAVNGVGLAFGNGVLQNGPDAVGLYRGNPADFPSGTPLTADQLVDAIVYGADDKPDAALLALLQTGQAQVDEDGRLAADTDSLQRCPNGSGGPRKTDAFRPDRPTPGEANRCIDDQAPTVASVSPPAGASDVALTSSLEVVFSEDVHQTAGWITLTCITTGKKTLVISGGPRRFTVRPYQPFGHGESCTATIQAAGIHDVDEDDPPDTLPDDYSWQFTTISPPVADHVLINEVDTNTPGADTAEFVELFDGGAGNTSLAGLVLVFGNGNDDAVYRAFDLSSFRTNEAGYFLAANPGLSGAMMTFPDGTLQNGPDVVALYRGQANEFLTVAKLNSRNLLDAMVYGPADQPDPELLPLLNRDQLQVDEDARFLGETDSLQRCPNGSGGQRNSDSIRPRPPTPGVENRCLADLAPAVESVSPKDGEQQTPVDARLSVSFNEDVAVDPGWLSLSCEVSGTHDLVITGGPRIYSADLSAELAYDETCTASVLASRVHDLDNDDPPDELPTDFTWHFVTEPLPVVEMVASFDHNGPLWIGQTAVFTNTSRGPAPLVFTWDFGDGSPPANDTHPLHTYARPGQYSITLTIRHGEVEKDYHADIDIRSRRVHLPVFPLSGPSFMSRQVYLPFLTALP